MKRLQGLTRAQSQGISAALMAGVWLVVYLIHMAVGGAFALPPNVLAVLVPLTPVIDQLAAWLMHGLSTGDWSFPLPLPSKPAPVVPPTPPAPPVNPPAPSA